MDDTTRSNQWLLLHCGFTAGVGLTLACVSPWFIASPDPHAPQTTASESPPEAQTDFASTTTALTSPRQTASANPEWLSNPLVWSPETQPEKPRFPPINFQAEIPRPFPPIGEEASPLPMTQPESTEETTTEAIDQTKSEFEEAIWEHELKDLPEEAAKEIRQLHHLIQQSELLDSTDQAAETKTEDSSDLADETAKD